jgi:hypothetical protein
VSGLFDSLLRFDSFAATTQILLHITCRTFSPLKKLSAKFAPYHETPFHFHSPHAEVLVSNRCDVRGARCLSSRKHSKINGAFFLQDECKIQHKKSFDPSPVSTSNPENLYSILLSISTKRENLLLLSKK